MIIARASKKTYQDRTKDSSQQYREDKIAYSRENKQAKLARKRGREEEGCGEGREIVG